MSKNMQTLLLVLAALILAAGALARLFMGEPQHRPAPPPGQGAPPAQGSGMGQPSTPGQGAGPESGTAPPPPPPQ